MWISSLENHLNYIIILEFTQNRGNTLALLGALLKNRTLSIISLVISILFFVALVGVLFLVLYAAAVVAHVILVSKHKKAVRGY